MGYFRTNPEPFFLLAKELFPGNYQPTPTHYFIRRGDVDPSGVGRQRVGRAHVETPKTLDPSRLLHEKGMLLRCYTQNIDSLEHLAGLPKDRIVAAHGNFDSAHCIECSEASRAASHLQLPGAGAGLARRDLNGYNVRSCLPSPRTRTAAAATR